MCRLGAMAPLEALMFAADARIRHVEIVFGGKVWIDCGMHVHDAGYAAAKRR